MHTGVDGMFFGGGFMWILWLILIVIIVYVVKDFLPNDSKKSSEDDAMEILRQRFARGEIDEQEFEQRKKELEK